MNRLIIDGKKGISGNALIGAALSLGLPQPLLEEACEALLGREAVDLIVRTEQQEEKKICYFNTEPGRKGKAVDVLTAKEALTRLSGSKLDNAIKEKTMKILLALFESKARAHGQPLEEVQFRYEGMVDTLVDALGAALTLSYFQAEELIIEGTLETGEGSIRLPKNVLPIPVPMVRLLLEGFVWTHGAYAGEKITPTGAAILKAFGKPLNGGCLVPSRTGFSYPVLPCAESQCFTLQLEEKKISIQD